MPSSPMRSSKENSSSSRISPSLPSQASIDTKVGALLKGRFPLPPRLASLTNSLQMQPTLSLIFRQVKERDATQKIIYL